MAGHLVDKGHDVTIISYNRAGEQAKILTEKQKFKLISVPALSISIPNFVKEFPFFLYLEQIMRQIKPDIVHINNLPFLTTYQSTRIARSLGFKNIVQVHGVIGANGILWDSLQEAYLLTVGRSVFDKTDGIICLTNRDSLTIQKLGCPFEKIRVIPNGVDVQKYHPNGEEVSNSLLWCGRFVHQKGLKYLIDALRIIVKEKGRSEIRLTMTGNGPLMPKIYQKIKKYNLESNITLLGLVPREDLPRIISKSSIFVLPSLNEGMPYVLLEAMASGKAVVGSDISGVNDVITDGTTGLLVAPRDSEGLANAILRLISDSILRNQVSRNARNLMVEKYNWKRIVEEIETVYYETI